MSDDLGGCVGVMVAVLITLFVIALGLLVIVVIGVIQGA